MTEQLSINRSKQMSKQKRLYRKRLRLIKAILAWIIVLIADSHTIWPYAVLSGQIKNMWAFST